MCGYGTCKDCSCPAGKISSFIQEYKRKIAPKNAVTLFNKMCRPNYLNPESVHITDQLKESAEYSHQMNSCTLRRDEDINCKI
jgi:hypothetical protein